MELRSSSIASASASSSGVFALKNGSGAPASSGVKSTSASGWRAAQTCTLRESPWASQSARSPRNASGQSPNTGWQRPNERASTIRPSAA